MSAVSILGTMVASQPASAGTFPGVNGKIAFSRSVEISPGIFDYNIYVMNPDGSGQTALTDDPDLELFPRWSPDGTKLAFSRDGTGIIIMNVDGSGETVLIGETGPARAMPSWSPDGTKIAFEMFAPDNYEIYVMNIDGTGLTRLTNTPVSEPSSVINFDGEPSWSPDGTKIAFRSDRDGNSEIYVMNADGTGATNLSNNDAINDSQPSWSPDGTKIAYTGAGVTVMNADGSGQTTLATGNGPSWSPDGTKIAFLGSGADYNVHVMNADGTGDVNLTNSSTREELPDWGTHPPSLPPEQSTLTINAADLSDSPINGMWTVIRLASDGTVLKTGFTPLTFTGNAGTAYKVSVANFDGKVFDHWENGSKSRTRTINLSADDMTIRASYDTGDTLRGFTPLTFTGTVEQPDLTVKAVSLDGSKTLHMWTIIDPQSSDASGTTYKVYASNYQDKVFHHWEDGSIDRTRTLTIPTDTAITAFYSTEAQNLKVEFTYEDCGLSSAGCGVGAIDCSGGEPSAVPSPISFAFALGVSKNSQNNIEGAWNAVVPGAAGPSGDHGTLTTLSFDGTNFKSEGTWQSVTGGNASSICGGKPIDNATITFSGQCSGTELRFETTNGVKGIIQGDITCTTTV